MAASPKLIDSHIHLIEPSSGLQNMWIQNDETVMGSLKQLRDEPWGVDQAMVELREFDVIASVHVQCADGPGDAVRETRWIAEQAERWSTIQAHIGQVDLFGGDVEDRLDEQLEASPLFKGVRDLGVLTKLGDAALDSGLAALAERDLIWEVQCVWQQFGAIREYAERHPALKIMLVHAGFPLERGEEYFAGWRDAIGDLARAQNVRCKLSGLGMADHDWTVASWRPWMVACVESFGVHRCTFGSNYPVDRIYASYGRILDAFEEIFAHLSLQERRQIYVQTAAEFYGIQAQAR
jgi:predicted TIM-barrel fold metal-dependent hydrolase